MYMWCSTSLLKPVIQLLAPTLQLTLTISPMESYCNIYTPDIMPPFVQRHGWKKCTRASSYLVGIAVQSTSLMQYTTLSLCQISPFRQHSRYNVFSKHTIEVHVCTCTYTTALSVNTSTSPSFCAYDIC